MSLIARIEEELADARRERDAERRDALSLILSQLRAAEKELRRPLHDEEELRSGQERENLPPAINASLFALPSRLQYQRSRAVAASHVTRWCS